MIIHFKKHRFELNDDMLKNFYELHLVSEIVKLKQEQREKKIIKMIKQNRGLVEKLIKLNNDELNKKLKSHKKIILKLKKGDKIPFIVE